MIQAPPRDAPPEAMQPHQVLGRLFGSLEERGIGWTLLRTPSNLKEPTGDVDILVSPADCDALRDVAAGLGFVALPGWESAPDLILACYDRPSDRWLLLEVTTTVSFRSPGARRLPVVAAKVLRRRQQRDGIAVPGDGDAFWLLLLHCLLDKGGVVAPHHRARLQQLAPTAPRSPIGGTVCSAAGGRWTPTLFTDPVRSGDWQELEQLGARLADELNRRRGAAERLQALATSALVAARKPLLLPRRKGTSLALLGPNGVGKSTTAEALQRSFPFESRVIYMGIWKEADSARGGRVGEVLTRPLRIWGKYVLAQYHQLRGRLVIFDRYVHEALLPARPPLVVLKRGYFRLLANAVPPARVGVVLDVPGHVAWARKQENPSDELESERRFYRRVAGKVRSMELVDAARDPETVRADITAIVWRDLSDRWRGRRDRLAVARALVPRILASGSGSLPPCARISAVVSAELTSTDMAVMVVAPVDEPACAVIKMPMSAEAARGAAREADALAVLQADGRLGQWRDLMPRPLASGKLMMQSYRVDSALTGRKLIDEVRAVGPRRRLLETAVETIHVLHRRTATTVLGDDRLAERWIDAHLDELLRHCVRRKVLVSRLERLRDELHCAVAGGTFSACWIHGDYWLGNLLFSQEGSRPTGIVDWEAAAPTELPVHDVLHLLTYTRRLLTGQELGQIVRRQLTDGGWSPQERRMLDRYGAWCHDATLSDRDALLLYWLRHVALHARQQSPPAGARYRLWERRNVHPVLEAL